MTTAAEIHRWLMLGGERNICDAFDAHVFASSFALALHEAQRGTSLQCSLGFGPEHLAKLLGATFPHAVEVFGRAPSDEVVEVTDDERMLRDLLFRGSNERSDLERDLAVLVARRAQRPNHLWQDLGLRNRRELSWLMDRHFEPLATRNTQDMKWKKFLYRAICRDTGFSLCTAPTCGECDDFDECFGDEAGQSLLAIQGTSNATINTGD